MFLPVATAVATTSHDGTVTHRTSPEWSDLALFAVAVAAVALTRRALRRRAKRDTRED